MSAGVVGANEPIPEGGIEQMHGLVVLPTGKTREFQRKVSDVAHDFLGAIAANDPYWIKTDVRYRDARDREFYTLTQFVRQIDGRVLVSGDEANRRD